MKKILITLSICFNFIYAEYDPFLYGYVTEELKKKQDYEKALIEEQKNKLENIEITIKKHVEENINVSNQNEFNNLVVKNDEELDKQFFEELNKIKKIKSYNSEKKVEVESIDNLLDNIKYFDEKNENDFQNDTINNRSKIDTKNIKEQNLIVDFDKNKKYLLLYEDKNAKYIRNKLIINNINNGYILKKNNINNVFGIIIDSSLYNINKINILYKEAKEISIEEIKANYDINKNYIN